AAPGRRVDAGRRRGEPRALRLAVDLKIGQVERSEYDEKTKMFAFVPARATEIAGWRGLDLSVVVRDARGLLHRFEGQRTTVDGGPHEMVVPLGAEANAADATFAYPLDLLGIEVVIRIPEPYQVPNARVPVGDLRSAEAPDAATWQPIPLQLPDGWRSTVAYFGRSPHGVEPNLRGAALVTEVGQPGIPALLGQDRFGGGTELRFAPARIAELSGSSIPIVASDALLKATASTVGDEIGLTSGGVRGEGPVASSVSAFPATDPADPVAVMDLATLSLLRFEDGGTV